MPVGEHRQLHLAQVNPQGGGVVRKFPRGARVQQQLVSPVLDVKGQPASELRQAPSGAVFSIKTTNFMGVLLSFVIPTG